jgi:hypothetical protein
VRATPEYPAYKDARRAFSCAGVDRPAKRSDGIEPLGRAEDQGNDEQLSSMDSASAPRITIKSKEVALIEPDGKAEFDETWAK